MFPWQKDNGEPRFTLLLTPLEDEVSVDRAALRQAGLTRLYSVAGAMKALAIINGEAGSPQIQVDSIICTGKPSDMGLEDFFRALAQLEKQIPVLVISASQQELTLALGQGASAVLSRPYSLNQLSQAVEKMRGPSYAGPAGSSPTNRIIPADRPHGPSSSNPAGSPSSSYRNFAVRNHSVLGAEANSQPGTEPSMSQGQEGSAQAAAKSMKQTKEDQGAGTVSGGDAGIATNQLLWTRQGISLLRQGKLEEARKLLVASKNYDPLDLEAATALSRSYQQEGNDDKSQRWLHRAGMICLSAGQPERAEVIFSRLPEKWQGDHELIEAQELLQEGDFDAACEAFINICTSRKGILLHQLLGRACQFTHSPDECLYEVIDALGRNGYESTARALAARLLHDRPAREEEHVGFLSNFPRLQEVVTVARFTAQAFRAV